MKVKKYWLLAPIIVIALILFGCDSDNSEDNSEEAARLEKERQNEEKIQELCSKYNAVTDWKQRFQKKTLGQHTYTVEVEDALIRADSRPILFYGVADDIVKETDKYIVYWSGGSYVDATFDRVFGRYFRFVLDCTPSQVEKIMGKSVSFFEHYAIIAQISEVEKVRFRLYSGESVEEVQLETADAFLAKGKCLDLLFVPDKWTDEQKNK